MRPRVGAFVVFVAGMFLLFAMVNLPPREISGGDLESLELNTRVTLSGGVADEKVIYEGTRSLELDNGIVVIVESSENFQGREVVVTGRVSEYEGEMQILVEEIVFS